MSARVAGGMTAATAATGVIRREVVSRGRGSQRRPETKVAAGGATTTAMATGMTKRDRAALAVRLLPAMSVDAAGLVGGMLAATMIRGLSGLAVRLLPPSATFAISDDSGLNSTGVGAYRMQHAVTATAFLSYSVGYSPQTATIAKNTNQTITVTGTVTPTQYGNAIAGNFTDTVTVTVSP